MVISLIEDLPKIVSQGKKEAQKIFQKTESHYKQMNLSCQQRQRGDISGRV